jgi:hypothetical protein
MPQGYQNDWAWPVQLKTLHKIYQLLRVNSRAKAILKSQLDHCMRAHHDSWTMGNLKLNRVRKGQTSEV